MQTAMVKQVMTSTFSYKVLVKVFDKFAMVKQVITSTFYYKVLVKVFDNICYDEASNDINIIL